MKRDGSDATIPGRGSAGKRDSDPGLQASLQAASTREEAKDGLVERDGRAGRVRPRPACRRETGRKQPVRIAKDAHAAPATSAGASSSGLRALPGPARPRAAAAWISARARARRSRGARERGRGRQRLWRGRTRATESGTSLRGGRLDPGRKSTGMRSTEAASAHPGRFTLSNALAAAPGRIAPYTEARASRRYCGPAHLRCPVTISIACVSSSALTGTPSRTPPTVAVQCD